MAFFVEKKIDGKRRYPPAIVEGTWATTVIGLIGPKEFRAFEPSVTGDHMDMRVWRWQRVCHQCEGISPDTKTTARLITEEEADRLAKKYKNFASPTLADHD